MTRFAQAARALAALTIASSAAAAPVVTGTIAARNGTPLADVQVQVEIRRVQDAGSSDAQGGFKFDAGALFSKSELRDGGALMLRFSKPGFSPANKLVRIADQPSITIKVQLDASGGSAALAPAEKQTLDKYAAAPGGAPLFLIPYSLSGVAADAKNVNETLRANLERVIVTHLQASAVGSASAVSLKLLPIEQVSDIERLRSYGSYLNALGMITGYGAVEGESGARSLDVSSTFLVVPQAGASGAPILYVDDALPADSVASPRLYKHLSKLWGRSTVLALGVNQYRVALAASDKEALKRVRAYLQAERSGAGPGDEALVSQLSSLIQTIDRELAR